MGQSQSRAPAFHPSSVGSHNYAAADEDPPGATQPYPTSASGWVKRPRSRFMGRRGPIASTELISYPHQPFIPKDQRQRSAGPIRSRPEPPEYGLRPSPFPPSISSPTLATPNGEQSPTTSSRMQRRPMDSSLLAEVVEAKSNRRTSAHRVSATPRDPPLLEEPESVRDHASADGHDLAPATPPSDHGHEPIPISPSLALALKAGLGSGSLRRRGDGALELEDSASGQPAGGGEQHESARDMRESENLWTCSPRRSIPEGWQSEWEDLRDRPSVDTPQHAAFGQADPIQSSRFSFGSSDPTTSSGTQSGGDSTRRVSSLYATPLDSQRFSYTASESGDSTHVSVLRPPRGASRTWSNVRQSLSSNDGLLAPVGAADSSLGNATRGVRRADATPSREKSNASLLSAAAASSDCDPSLSRDHRDEVLAGAMSVSENRSDEGPASTSNGTVHRAFDRYEEPGAPVAPSRRSSMLRSVYSDAAASGVSSLGTGEVEELRRGPEVKRHDGSTDVVFDPQPAPASRRPRALSLMDKLRGMTTRTAEASTAAPHMVTVQAQPTSGAANTGSMRSRFRSISLVSANRSASETTRPQSTRTILPQPNQPSVLTNTALSSAPVDKIRSESRAAQGLNGPKPQVGLETQPARLSPREVVDLSRPTSGRSVHTARSIRSVRSYTSSNGSLRTRYKAPSSSIAARAKAKTIASDGLAGSSWWKHNNLKRKGSEGIVAEAQAPKQGRPTAHGGDDSAWVDLGPELEATEVKEPISPRQGDGDTPATVTKSRPREAGGLWIWPRRPSAARVFGFGLGRSQPTAAEPGLVPPIVVAKGALVEAERSPVNVIGMVVDQSTSTTGGGHAGPSTSNSSQTSFTSLAPPLPPAPVPPPRRPRRPSQKPNIDGKERSGSTGSNTEAAYADSSIGSGHVNVHQPNASSVASLEPSEATASAVPISTTSTATSLTLQPSSTAPTSVAAGADQAGREHRKDFALSPPPEAPPRLSDVSSSGTKEILLSDRESLLAPKISSDSSLRGPVDEQHPDLQSFYPAGAAYVRPVVTPLAITSPLSPMSEEDAGVPPPRRVGGVPDLSSPRSSLGPGPPPAKAVSPHLNDSSLAEASRSFRSVRSFRSTSDGSARPYRPLPSIPSRPRGYSADHTSNRRDPSGSESFVTAAAHSRYGSIEQPEDRQVEGLPTHDTQLSPLMLMGMVAAASSPTQWTSSSQEHAIANGQAVHCGPPSRSSMASVPSPTGYSRPLPAIPTGRMQAKYESLTTAPQRLVIASSGGGSGPPLSPSAFYETRSSSKSLPLRSPAGPRSSRSSVDAAGLSATSAVRGMNFPEWTVDGTDMLRRALSHPREDLYDETALQRTSATGEDAEDDDEELTRLEKSRSGSRVIPPVRAETSRGQVDAIEPAPFADTGVQASLAALRALESPGESLRTILARQRMFGEPDASVSEFLRESSLLDSDTRLDDSEGFVLNGPRPRRRTAPYMRPRSSRYSSDEVSSSSRSRANAARRRRRMNLTGMAEASSGSLEETSGRGSDSDGATLAAIRSVRSRSGAERVDAHLSRIARRQGRNQSPASRRKAWEELAGVSDDRAGQQPIYSEHVPAATNVGTLRSSPNLVQRAPDPVAEDGRRERQTHHDRYVTATSRQDAVSETDQTRPHTSGLPSAAQEDRLDVSGEVDSYSAAVSPASTMSPALLLKHERVASQVPSTTVSVGPGVVFPSSVGTGGTRSIQPPSVRSTSMQYPSSIDTRRSTYGTHERESFLAMERVSRRTSVAHPRQRSRSDAYMSRSGDSRVDMHGRGGRNVEASRYDAQLEDLLLLREKVLQLERSGKTSRFDSINSTTSIAENHAYDPEGLRRRPRHSSVSSKHQSRPSKLGYTAPDIMAWKAGLGSGTSASSYVA